MDINKMSSELKMENFYFSDCNITRANNIKSEPLNINLEKDIQKVQKGVYSITLTLTISKAEQDLSVRVIANANFMMDNKNEDFVNTIMNTNAIAIMFPFIRSQVSLLTTQPGMSPVVLPPINTEKFQN